MPEVWMNERLMRCAPNNFAEFLTAFEEPDPKVHSTLLALCCKYLVSCVDFCS